MLTIILVALSAVAQFYTAYMGWRVTARPPLEANKRKHEVAFIAIGLIGVIALAFGAWQAGRDQATLVSQLENLGKGQQRTNTGIDVILQTVGKPAAQVLPSSPPPKPGIVDRARVHVMGGSLYEDFVGRPIYDNVSFQNIGRQRATVEIYSMSGLAKGQDENMAAEEELLTGLNKLVKGGGGLKFTVEPGPPGLWFTIFGPALSQDQLEKLRNGEYAAYYLAALVYRDSRGVHRTNYCVFSHIPSVSLMCQKHNEEL